MPCLFGAALFLIEDWEIKGFKEIREFKEDKEFED